MKRLAVVWLVAACSSGEPSAAATGSAWQKHFDAPRDAAIPPADAYEDPLARLPPSGPAVDPNPPASNPLQPPPLAAVCDEVSCILNNYDGLCCDRFRRRPRLPVPPPDPNAPPESLDRTMISAGIGLVKARVMQCADAHPGITGTVKVSVKVDPNGTIANLTLKESPDPGLGACVVAAVKRATFGKTQNGGSFSYPWRF